MIWKSTLKRLALNGKLNLTDGLERRVNSRANGLLWRRSSLKQEFNSSLSFLSKTDLATLRLGVAFVGTGTAGSEKEAVTLGFLLLTLFAELIESGQCGGQFHLCAGLKVFSIIKVNNAKAKSYLMSGAAGLTAGGSLLVMLGVRDQMIDVGERVLHLLLCGDVDLKISAKFSMHKYKCTCSVPVRERLLSWPSPPGPSAPRFFDSSPPCWLLLLLLLIVFLALRRLDDFCV